MFGGAAMTRRRHLQYMYIYIYICIYAHILSNRIGSYRVLLILPMYNFHMKSGDVMAYRIFLDPLIRKGPKPGLGCGNGRINKFEKHTRIYTKYMYKKYNEYKMAASKSPIYPRHPLGGAKRPSGPQKVYCKVWPLLNNHS